jgi:hypothetical protein
MKNHVIRKTALFFLGLFLLNIPIFAEVYSTHFFTIDTDLDNLKFFNNTNDDLIIKYDCGAKCNYVTVKAKKDASIGIGIEAENNIWIDIPVRFEVKTTDMKEKKVSWTMNNKKSDINIIIEEDQGWSF